MRIAYIHYLCHGDTALHHVHQFASAARDLGQEVDVHALNLAGGAPGDGKRERSFSARLRRTLKKHLSRYLHEPKELLWNLRYAAIETRMLRSERPDVLLVRDQAITSSCVPVARRLGLPLVLEFNAPAEETRLYFDQYLHLPLIPDWLERWKLRRADAVTVVSSALRDHLVARHGLPKERFHVVPNGADVGRFHPAVPPDPEVSRRLAGGPVVGFIGSFQKFHGPELLAGLVHDVGSARPDVRFLLIGDGLKASAIREKIRHLGDRVLFVGRVPHERVPGLTATFDVAVLPETAFYTSPLKVLEWMAAGRAVVAPAYDPLREILEDGSDGLLFTPKDARALAGAVLRLIEDPGLRRRLGEAAVKRVHSSLTWTHNAQRVVAACERALERHRPKPATATQPRSAGR